MSMHSLLAVAASALAFVCSSAFADSPNLGRVATPEEIAAWDISIAPDGAGLPPGSGTPKAGETVYVAKCLACHGEKGVGKPDDPLVGGRGTLSRDQVPIKTVGRFWPCATTILHYRPPSMPLNETTSLAHVHDFQ